MMAGERFTLGFILSLALVFFSWHDARSAQASCGLASHPDDEPDRVDLRQRAAAHGENPRLCLAHEHALDGVHARQERREPLGEITWHRADRHAHSRRAVQKRSCGTEGEPSGDRRLIISAYTTFDYFSRQGGESHPIGAINIVEPLS